MIAGDIHEFARQGNMEALKQAIDAGVDLNAKDKFDTTALQYAISEKQIGAVNVLLAAGADAASQDRDGKTALHYAIEFNLCSVAERLLQTHPELVSIGDKHGNQPLWIATFNARGKYELVSLLLRYGADPEHRNTSNLSPLDIPKRRQEPALMELLRKSNGPEE